MSRLPASLIGLWAVLISATFACAARADAPLDFHTVHLPLADGSGTEPRVTVGPDDVRWVITNVSRSSGTGAVVFRSLDGGQTWQPTVGRPVQTRATIDVDIVAMRTGRILGSELDDAGLNFPSSFTDNGGVTWTASRGSTQLADQDRQWFAVGPDDPQTHLPRVYLLFHNLSSGEAQHNMFVSTSTDGGQTFGVPVPVAPPGSDAYTDLQCADSGGPSSIGVNPRTGRIYVVFTTRAAHIAPGTPDFGGCAAQPAEFNIVNATRVWVATSPDGSIGSWKDTLAVDDSTSGQVVSMQLAYGALDNQGGMYVAYPESPQPYPEIGGAALKLVYQKPDANGDLSDNRWTRPVTLVPASDPASGGVTLVHLAAGDPGKVAIAYYRGIRIPGQDKPIWYTRVLHSIDILAPTPVIVDQLLSPVPTYKWTANEMMGICTASGIVNGVACDRSTDVWGIALDRQCRLSVAWPTSTLTQGGSTKGVPGSAPGTYVSTQTGGPTLCGPGSLPGVAGAFLGPGPAGGAAGGAGGCVDRLAPRSRVAGRIHATRRGIRFHGRSHDLACVNGRPGQRIRGGVRSVSVAIGRRLPRHRCRFLLGNGQFSSPRSCLRTIYLPARGTTAWSFAAHTRLRPGRYVVWVRGVDLSNNIERKARRRNLARFRVR